MNHVLSGTKECIPSSTAATTTEKSTLANVVTPSSGLTFHCKLIMDDLRLFSTAYMLHATELS